MNHLDQLRFQHLRYLSTRPSISEATPYWASFVSGFIETDESRRAASILDLGDKLRSIFLTTGESGRKQTALSSGGRAWEFLVCWYLNCVFWGTNTIVLKSGKQFVPEVLRNSLTVTINNVRANTETDLILLHLPQLARLQNASFESMGDLTREYFSDAEVCVIQCKTNWNDNSQIPMLWNAIYEAGKADLPNLHVGTNGVSIKDLKSFKYAFATAPTNKTEYKPNSTAVLRVSTLSGRNYWGKQSKNGVALSLKEFFNLYHQSFAGSGGTIKHIKSNLAQDLSGLESAVNMKFNGI